MEPHLIHDNPRSDPVTSTWIEEVKGGPEAAANVVWVNRGITSGANDDRFDDVFGANAATARAVMDAVLVMWERVIGDFNYSDGSSNLDVTIKMDSAGTSLGAAANITSYLNGKPKAGRITMGRGSGGTGGGWFIDPTPFDNSEFTGTMDNLFSRNATTGGPAAGMSDFQTVALAELTHVVGLLSNAAAPGNSLFENSPNLADTNINDAEASGPDLYTYNGTQIDHLMTEFDSGAGAWGAAIHSAGPQTVSISSSSWTGTNDVGNAYYESGRRYLVSENMRLLFDEIYGYSTVSASTFGSFLANVEADGDLMIRGQEGVSNDVISVNRSGSDYIVSVDLGADDAGTGNLRGAGNLGAWSHTFAASTVSRIIIDAGDGNDTINILGLASGDTVSINAGAGSDFVQIGNGDVDTEVLGDVTTLIGGSGTDSLSFFDLLDDVGNDIYTVTSTSISKTGFTAMPYATMEDISIACSGLDNTINLQSALNGAEYSLLGLGGNDTFNIASTNLNLGNIDGLTTVSGGAGTDSVNFLDTANTVSSVYSYSLTTLARSGMDTVTYSTMEQISIAAGTGNDSLQIGVFESTRTLFANMGDGTDLVQVGSDLDTNLVGEVHLTGGLGVDELWLTDTADAGSDTYGFSSTALQKTPTAIPGTLSYGTFESFLLDLPAGNETVIIQSLASGHSITVQGNDGADEVQIGTGDWDSQVFGDVSVVGGAGIDSIVINDSLDNAPGDAYTVAANSIVKDIYADFVNHSSVESVALTATTGNDDIAITGNSSIVTLNVSALDGADSITVGAGDIDSTIFGPVSVNAGAGSDTVVFNDTTDGAGSDGYTLASGSFAKTLISPAILFSLSELNIVNASPNADLITVSSGTEWQVNSGGGVDTIDVIGIAAGDRVTVNGGAGRDNVSVNSDNAGVAAVEFLASDDLGTLDVHVGGTAVVTSNGTTVLDTTNTLVGGLIQLNNNRLIDRDNGAPPTAVFDTLLRQGYNGGNWLGAQPAINSPYASLTGGSVDGLGMAVAAAAGVTSFGGITVGGNDLLVGYTLAGDTNLDRTVNFTDLLTVAQNYNLAGRFWYQGNFDYDASGGVAFPDLLVLAQNYGLSVPGLRGSTATETVVNRSTRKVGASELIDAV